MTSGMRGKRSGSIHDHQATSNAQSPSSSLFPSVGPSHAMIGAVGGGGGRIIFFGGGEERVTRNLNPTD